MSIDEIIYQALLPILANTHNTELPPSPTYPALVFDASYHDVAANRGIMMLLDGVPESLLRPPLNTMRLTLHPEGLAPRILNLPQWRGHLLEQMRRQIALRRLSSARQICATLAEELKQDTP